MTRKRFMIIAGEASGDLLAAELVRSLRQQLAQRQARFTTDTQPLGTSLEPEFFGAGGPAMQAAGVDLAFDMTAHAVVGLVEALKNLRKFHGFLERLVSLAIERQPHAIICVDFSGFNRRFGHAVAKRRKSQSAFLNWRPKLIQYVSPQVWASRPGRAGKMARDFDLLLSIFPFEEKWYAEHTPGFLARFVGHPLVDRYRDFQTAPPKKENRDARPLVALLPGSRKGELAQHLPVMREALKRMQSQLDLRWRMILPSPLLRESAHASFSNVTGGEICAGGLAEALSEADLAIASTGTVTMECAWFSVPTVAIYKTSWSTYEIGKRIIKVRFLAMPNILADEPLFPELIQNEATGERIADAALRLLRDPAERQRIREKLATVCKSLGQPGAPKRAADAILDLLGV